MGGWDWLGDVLDLLSKKSLPDIVLSARNHELSATVYGTSLSCKELPPPCTALKAKIPLQGLAQKENFIEIASKPSTLNCELHRKLNPSI